MAGFLEDYGVGEVRREKAIRWIVISTAILLVAAFVAYFSLRTWPAKRQVRSFLEELRRGDYQAAYRVWGCSQPCPDYSFERFMEDWGPKGVFGHAAQGNVADASFCNSGVIVKVTPAQGDEIALWYQRSDATLGFSPWPMCVERIPAPTVPEK